MEVWLELLKTMGVPGLFAGGLLALIWKLGKWMEPRASRLIDSHIETMESVSCSVTSVKDSLKEQTTVMKETCQTLKGISEKTNEIHSAVHGNAEGKTA